MKVPNLIKDYVNTITEQYLILHPELDYKIVHKEVMNIVKSNIFNPKCKFSEEDTSLLSVVNMIETENPIITGYGTMFTQHKEIKSVEWYLVNDFTVLRSKNKDLKFEHINDDDKRLFNMYDIFQLTFKLLNNSFYGASNEPNSFFYHPLIGPSVTQTGVIVITTAVNLFEKSCSNNFFFRTFTDCMIYVNNILKEEYDIEDYIDEYVDGDKFEEYMCSHFKSLTPEIKEKVHNLRKKLTISKMNKIYYKNNFYEFMDNCEEYRNVLSGILGNEDFLDPNKPKLIDKDTGEELYNYLDELEYLWKVFDLVIHYNYMDFYRYENARYGIRKTVLTVDTDSNFIYTYPFYDYCQRISSFEENITTTITTTNILMYILTELIAKSYAMLTKNFNIENEEMRKFIKMKNELRRKSSDIQ